MDVENISVINIGMKIKKLRENANLTQKQVADYLSIDQSLVSKFEKGERSINSDLLNDIANLFCCPIQDLVSDKDITSIYTIAFRTGSIETADLYALSVINKIALNQFKMDQLAGGIENDQ